MPVRAVVALLAAAAALAAGCGGEEQAAPRETAYGVGSGGRVDVGDGPSGAARSRGRSPAGSTSGRVRHWAATSGRSGTPGWW